MEIKVINKEGQDVGKSIELKDSIFNVEPNDHAIYLDVKQYMANNRQGTHKAKERGEIKGSTRKIKKQKGTGTARAGSIKSPIFRGGGRIFGPKPRDYSFKLNKKLKKLARKSALTYKAKNNEIIVVEDFTFEHVKTSEFVKFENNLKINDKKSLLILKNENINLYLSSRNLKNAKVITANELSTYDILKYKNLVFFESSIEVVNSILDN